MLSGKYRLIRYSILLGLLGGLVLAYPSMASSVTIQIDIKPASDPNSINLCSMGAIPVAILGSATLDVNDIDRGTLRLAGNQVKMAGKSGNDMCSVEDVNNDGFDDLVCHYITVDLALSAGDLVTTVNGQLLDGTPIEGADSVNIVKDC